MAVTIFHNPRCTTSRKVLAMLQDKGITPTVIKYLKTPPDAKTLKGILDKLGMEPRTLMRKKESEYKDLGLDDPKLGKDALIRAMVDNPILIERPIVLSGSKAALGRPPENILKIL